MLTKNTAVILIYNLAVLISGMWVVTTYGLTRKWQLFMIAVLLGIVWTAYFQYSIVPRLSGSMENREPAVEETS